MWIVLFVLICFHIPQRERERESGNKFKIESRIEIAREIARNLVFDDGGSNK